MDAMDFWAADVLPSSRSLGVGVASVGPVGSTRAGRWVCWRRGPGGVDDRLELGPQQVPVGTDQIEELVGGVTEVGLSTAGHRGHAGSPAQVVTAC